MQQAGTDCIVSAACNRPPLAGVALEAGVARVVLGFHGIVLPVPQLCHLLLRRIHPPIQQRQACRGGCGPGCGYGKRATRWVGCGVGACGGQGAQGLSGALCLKVHGAA